MDKSDAQIVEDYEFHRLYRIDVERGRQLLQLAKAQTGDNVRFPLVELAIICYARPFSKNFGTTIKRHWLHEDIVPAELLPLHSELLALRAQAFAHTDHTFRKPQVGRFPRGDGTNHYIVGFRNPDYIGLIGRIGELESLMRVVEDAIAARAEEMHSRLDDISGTPPDVDT